MQAVLYVRDRNKDGDVWTTYGTFELWGLNMLVKDNRALVRASLEEQFTKMLNLNIRVRFTDECPECWNPIGPYGCESKGFALGGPPVQVLAILMANHPAGVTETVLNYYARLKYIWNSEQPIPEASDGGYAKPKESE